MENIEKLELALASARVEAEKFYNNGNKSAGTRLRQKMMEVTQLAKAVRVDVSEIKNAD